LSYLEYTTTRAVNDKDSAGEIGRAIWVGKQSENTDFQQGTARRIIPISPAESWDLHNREII
jgi:hypothetical protein